MKYKTEILANIDAAKTALEAGALTICYQHTELVRGWFELEKAYAELDLLPLRMPAQNKSLEELDPELNAAILSIFDHPMYHKKEAE